MLGVLNDGSKYFSCSVMSVTFDVAVSQGDHIGILFFFFFYMVGASRSHLWVSLLMYANLSWFMHWKWMMYFFFSTGNMHFLLTTIGMAAFLRKGNLFLLKAMWIGCLVQNFWNVLYRTCVILCPHFTVNQHRNPALSICLYYCCLSLYSGIQTALRGQLTSFSLERRWQKTFTLVSEYSFIACCCS